MRTARFTLGRWLMHLGLNIMPPGRVKQEITDILTEWGKHVVRTVEENRI